MSVPSQELKRQWELTNGTPQVAALFAAQASSQQLPGSTTYNMAGGAGSYGTSTAVLSGTMPGAVPGAVVGAMVPGGEGQPFVGPGPGGAMVVAVPAWMVQNGVGNGPILVGSPDGGTPIAQNPVWGSVQAQQAFQNFMPQENRYWMDDAAASTATPSSASAVTLSTSTPATSSVGSMLSHLAGTASSPLGTTSWGKKPFNPAAGEFSHEGGGSTPAGQTAASTLDNKASFEEIERGGGLKLNIASPEEIERGGLFDDSPRGIKADVVGPRGGSPSLSLDGGEGSAAPRATTRADENHDEDVLNRYEQQLESALDEIRGLGAAPGEV